MIYSRAGGNVVLSAKERLHHALKIRSRATKLSNHIVRKVGARKRHLSKKALLTHGSLSVRRGTSIVSAQRKDLSSAVKKSWNTRRQKYGKAGRVKRRKK